GTMAKDITTEVIGTSKDGKPVYLKDIWPTNEEIQDYIKQAVTSEMFKARYANVFLGDEYWQGIKVGTGQTYNWSSESTYVQNPPYFQNISMSNERAGDIVGARPLAVLGDSITTDHISPAGNITEKSPAGQYLLQRGVERKDFNSYGSRRGNHEVMMRGTFANIRIRNEMVPGTEGGITKHVPSGEVMPIYDASMKYQAEGTQLVIVAGKEYGTGSSRDWAAKGTNLLGVKAVIAESYERIHRSNLVGMAVLPLQFKDGQSRLTLGLDGTETFTIRGVGNLRPRQDVEVEVTRANGETFTFTAQCRIDTENEIEYFYSGGVLTYVLRKLAA